MILYLSYNEHSETLNFAVSEFCRHLSLCTTDITFIHNPTDRLADSSCINIIFQTEVFSSYNAADDFYHVSLKPEGGIFSGSNERSVLLAVYAYLRKLGFRFLLPDKTLSPKMLSFAELFMEFSHRASLRHRGICIEGADSLENILDFIDWLPKLGFNSFFLQFHEPYIFLERWYHHHLNPLAVPKQYSQPEKLTEEFLQNCYQKINKALQTRSILCHAGGHGWTCEAIGLPSIGWVTENTKPTAEHEAMLAYVNGKRTYIDSVPMNTNLCYSNPDAIEQFCQCVLSYIETHPAVDYLHIWLADEPNHVCECEACKKTTPTDQYIHLLNEIDRRLTEKKLDCKLVFLLYQELLYAPKEEHLLNPERFLLMFAPISRTFKESYPDKITDVPLPEYKRNQMQLPVTINENLTYLHKWQQQLAQGSHSHSDSFIYDYPLGRAHYGDFGYIAISKILAGDIKNIKNLGLNGYISCQELRAFLPNGLPNYIMGYLTLDENETFEQLMEEYFAAAYGSSYKHALAFLSAMSELSDCDYINRIGARTNPVLNSQYKQLLAQAIDFSSLAAAQQQHYEADSDFNTAKDLHTFFWKLLSYHTDYVIHLSNALICLTNGDITAADEKYAAFCRFIQENEFYMQPYLDVYRILEVTSKYTGFHMPETLK